MLEPYVLDREAILERLGDDEEIFSMMVSLFLDDVENCCAALAAAMAAGDAAQLQCEAHTVKGLLATFSDQPGADLALALEKLARGGSLAEAGELLARLDSRLREVATVLCAL